MTNAPLVGGALVYDDLTGNVVSRVAPAHPQQTDPDLAWLVEAGGQR